MDHGLGLGSGRGQLASVLTATRYMPREPLCNEYIGKRGGGGGVYNAL